MRLPRDRFDYSPISARRPWTLPKGARIAVWTIVNIVPHRIKYFEAVYDYMRKKPGVWMTTGEEIYEWFKQARR